MAYICTKFEDCILYSRDMIGAQKFKMGQVM